MALKEFVLFRHAKKNFDSIDPDLSQDGLKQALRILESVQKNELPTPQFLFTSPKKRAQQTLSILQEELQIPLIIEPALDEQNSEEPSSAFRNRVIQFLTKDLPSKNINFAFLCTHLDWLEMFAAVAPLKVDLSSEIIHIPPAHYYHVSLSREANHPWDLLKKGGIP